MYLLPDVSRRVPNRLQFALHQCRRILDALYSPHLANNHPGQLKKAFNFGHGNGVPLSEHEIDVSDSGNSTNLGHCLQPWNQLD